MSMYQYTLLCAVFDSKVFHCLVWASAWKKNTYLAPTPELFIAGVPRRKCYNFRKQGIANNPVESSKLSPHHTHPYPKILARIGTKWLNEGNTTKNQHGELKSPAQNAMSQATAHAKDHVSFLSWQILWKQTPRTQSLDSPARWHRSLKTPPLCKWRSVLQILPVLKPFLVLLHILKTRIY